jgi:predicted lipid-binding transport protein (Tim44 family)
VLNIDAALLEVATEGAYTIASVRYTGQLRENNGAIENIDEIWHLQKALHPSDAPWLLAGIQQA